MRYATIVADPPWDYGELTSAGSRGWVGFGQRTPGREGAVNGRGAQQHYGLMPLNKIKALDVCALAEPDAHLYLWVTNAFVVQGHEVMAAWGFTFKTMLTWVKPQIGMGYYFRSNTEHILFGVRGKLRTTSRAIPTSFTAPRTRHSAKPEAFFDLVTSTSPGPYLSIFERAERLGWDAIGDEIGKPFPAVAIGPTSDGGLLDAADAQQQRIDAVVAARVQA